VAEAKLNAILDNFYGEDYLADSDSDSEDEAASSEGSIAESRETKDEEKLSVEEKFQFRARQRGTLQSMLTKEERPKILLSLIDSGLGIKVIDQMKLFKLFGCLKSSRKLNTKGVGLGLSITKMISEEFGGTVTVHSKKGRGSTF